MCLTSREDGSTSVWEGTQQRLLAPLTLRLLAPRAAHSPCGLRRKWTETRWVCSTLPSHLLSSAPALSVPGSTFVYSDPFLNAHIPSCKGNAQSYHWVYTLEFLLDLTLDRWMNVTPWQKSCQYAVMTNGKREHESIKVQWILMSGGIKF